MSQNELRHSSIYLGRDYDDGIKHWKYVKKEKVNGKWKYYYKDDEYDNAKTEYENAKNKYERTKYLNELSYKSYRDSYNNMNNTMRLKKKNSLDKTSAAINETVNAKRSYEKSRDSMYEAKSAVDKALVNLNKIGKKETIRKTISKGMVAVGNILSKMPKMSINKMTYKGKSSYYISWD